MADYDRGAYTPQTDAPLAFDPRRPSERRPMPMALIGSAVVLVVLLAGVAMVYRSGVRHAGEAPRPVGEPVMSVKTAPAPGTETAARGAPANLDVYNAGGAASAASTTSNTTAAAPPAPVFAPAVEQPAARPAPKPSTLALLAKPQAPAVRRPTPAQSEAARIAEDAQVKPTATAPAATPAPAPVRTAVVHPAVKPHAVDDAEVAAAGMTRASVAKAADDDDNTPAAPPLRKAVPPPVKIAAATTAPAKTAPATSASAAPTTSTAPVGAVVQIGAFSSDALATKGYADVSAAMAGRMAGKSRRVAPLQRDGKTLYRTWVSGFGSRADAAAFCEALKAKGKICIVKG